MSSAEAEMRSEAAMSKLCEEISSSKMCLSIKVALVIPLLGSELTARSRDTPETLTASSNSSSSETQLVRPPLARVDTNKSSGQASASSNEFSVENVENVSQDQKDFKILSKDSFDDWGPSEYQGLLTSMVENIEDDFKDAKVSSSLSHQSQSSSQPGTLAHSGGRVPSPSSFSITSVDPLHFLGIHPTYESGELLQACESSTLAFPMSR